MKSFDRQIRYFLAVAELRSLSRTAESLDLTQSGISRQLAALEAHLGVPLFHRTGRGVELTEAGSLLRAAALPAYRAIDEALLAIGEQRAGEGKLKIATVHTLSYYFMAEAVTRFLGRRPKTTVSLILRSSPEVVELVERGQADLGFVYDAAVASPRLRSVPLFDDRMCLIAGPGFEAAAQGIDLSERRLPLVVFPSHYALRRMLHSSSIEFDIAAEAETVASMLELVSSGMGACILPERIPTRRLTEYGLSKLPIVRPTLSRRVVGIVRNDVPTAPATQAMLDAALAELH